MRRGRQWGVATIGLWYLTIAIAGLDELLEQAKSKQQ